MSRRIASTIAVVQPQHALEVARVADVHRVGDRLHRRARRRSGRCARYSGTTSLTLVAATKRAIGRPARLAISPAVRLPKLPLGVQTAMSGAGSDMARASFGHRVEVVDHLRQQPADVDRVGRRQPHAAAQRRGRRTPPCVSRWQSSKLPATAYARTLPSSRVEHRQLRFLRRADAALGIQDDDARVRHAVKRVRDGAAGVAGGRRQHGQRLIAACRAPPSAAPSSARRRP